MSEKEIDDILGCGFAKDTMDMLETLTALTISEFESAQPVMAITLNAHLKECVECRKIYEGLSILKRKS
jgi:hypothetical protein